MPHLNFEFKAQTNKLTDLENKFLALDPVFMGEDHQMDTYFRVPKGRLKLREGIIENSLIYYERENTAEPRPSNITLYDHVPGKGLKEILFKLYEVKVVVDKKRKIYFIDNVKFHFDMVKGLGTFIEVEAIDQNASLGVQKLKEQCEKYGSFFGIRKADYIGFSYSDLILKNQQKIGVDLY
jgi:adenylate cyclase class 2